jgi:hypothetical protein
VQVPRRVGDVEVAPEFADNIRVEPELDKSPGVGAGNTVVLHDIPRDRIGARLLDHFDIGVGDDRRVGRRCRIYVSIIVGEVAADDLPVNVYNIQLMDPERVGEALEVRVVVQVQRARLGLHADDFGDHMAERDVLPAQLAEDDALGGGGAFDFTDERFQVGLDNTADHLIYRAPGREVTRQCSDYSRREHDRQYGQRNLPFYFHELYPASIQSAVPVRASIRVAANEIVSQSGTQRN